MKLKIITLNCWGVFTPLACEKRHERLAAISDNLSEGEFDIVFLQEIWTDGDFEKIRKKMLKSYSHSHYFHSNLIGSGCCIFSRHPIAETFYYRYGANGFPHRIQHGDWFGGKGVGMARVRLQPGDLTVSCYVTHLHAQYSREADEYLAHRLSQAYELSTFVRLTSAGSDAVLLCGDFNLSPETLGLRLLLANSGLRDAWTTHAGAAACPDKEGFTCDRPGNSFTSRVRPHPERLDYVLYGGCSGARVECTDCQLALGRVPGQEFNYSDHEAVRADLQISRAVTQPGIGPDRPQRRALLTQCLPLVRDGVRSAGRDRLYYGVCLLLALLLLLAASRLLGAGWLGLPIICLDAVYIGFLVWTIVVVKKAEMRALTNTQLAMERLLADEAEDAE